MASLSGLGADDLGRMVSGNGVSDCQHDKVGLSYGHKVMTLARWPNVKVPIDETAPWRWSRSHSSCVYSDLGTTIPINITAEPEALRLLKWADENEPFLHGYFDWDWYVSSAL